MAPCGVSQNINRGDDTDERQGSCGERQTCKPIQDSQTEREKKSRLIHRVAKHFIESSPIGFFPEARIGFVKNATTGAAKI
jgi:hypothetical protein